MRDVGAWRDVWVGQIPILFCLRAPVKMRTLIPLPLILAPVVQPVWVPFDRCGHIPYHSACNKRRTTVPYYSTADGSDLTIFAFRMI